jgi:hypothetical protein
MRPILRSAAVFSGLLVGASTLTPVWAAQKTSTVVAHPKMYHTAILWSGKALSQPGGFAQSGTTYMPIWYVAEALKTLKVTNTWDGHNLRLTVPNTVKVDLTKLTPGNGDMHIYLNGKLVQSVLGAYAKDPSSGKMTTYMPIWYVMQVLKRVGVTSTWKSSHWSMEPQAAAGSGTQTGSKTGTKTGSGTGTGTSTGSKTGGGTGTGTGTKTGGGTSAGTGTGSKTGGTTGTPTPPPVVNNTGLTQGEFLVQFLQTLGVQPVPMTKSPFDDVKVTDSDAGYVNAALLDNLVHPDTPTHFGVSDPVPMNWIDGMYWTFKGMAHPTYEPGVDQYHWGQIIGLNVPGVGQMQNLVPSQVPVVLGNLKALQQGYQQTPTGVYQIRYPAADEYNATFATDSVNGRSFFNATTAQQAILKTYGFFNNMTATVSGTDTMISIPNLVGSQWFAYATSTNGIQYSLDGGKTWQSTPVFDTRNLPAAAVPSSQGTLLLKYPTTDGMGISFNQLLPSFAGSVSLGMLTLGYSNGQLTVQRSE